SQMLRSLQKVKVGNLCSMAAVLIVVGGALRASESRIRAGRSKLGRRTQRIFSCRHTAIKLISEASKYGDSPVRTQILWYGLRRLTLWPVNTVHSALPCDFIMENRSKPLPIGSGGRKKSGSGGTI